MHNTVNIAVGSLMKMKCPSTVCMTNAMVWPYIGKIPANKLVIILQKAHMKEKADREYVAEIITACGINGWVWFQNIDEV